jgi:hypothetical protein
VETTEQVTPETTGAEAAPVGEPEAGAAEQGQDFAPLLERFDEMSQALGQSLTQTLDDRLGPIEQRLPQPESEAEPRQAGLDEETYYDPARFSQWLEERDQQVHDRLMTKVQETLQPVLERDTERDFEALEQEYPGITEPEVMKAVGETVRGLAARHQNPGLLSDPRLARLAYEAHVGQQHIGQETPAGAQQDAAALEMGGANPANPEVSQYERLSQQQEKDAGKSFFGMV